MDTSLNAYAHEFEKALKKERPYANYNKDMQHASIIVCMSFRHASKHIRLLSNCLDQSLYGTQWFMDELNGFLKRNGKLEILLETEVPADHPVLTRARNEPSISVKRMPDGFLDEYPFNFMLVDDTGFRFESDRAKPAASVAFNYDNDDEFRAFRQEAIEWFDRKFRSVGDCVA